MKAVWSFWSRPFEQALGSTWGSLSGFLHSWVLSCGLGRTHYPDTELHTDSEGARLLVDRLQIPFERVYLTLDALKSHDPRWWALGKLYAYREQTSHFMHIDHDVFLWNRLPADVEGAAVAAQSPERFVPGDSTSWYPVLEVEDCFTRAGTGCIPDEWRWYRAQSPSQEAACCGILGGTRADFLRYYADLGIRMVEDEKNKGAWGRFRDLSLCNVLIEQYLLRACVDYHRAHPASAFADVAISYLFSSPEAPYSNAEAEGVGYTHLIGGAKRSAVVLEDLRRRVMCDYPDAYDRCMRLAHNPVSGPPAGAPASGTVHAEHTDFLRHR